MYWRIIKLILKDKYAEMRIRQRPWQQKRS